jgi:hypothetical protein
LGNGETLANDVGHVVLHLEQTMQAEWITQPVGAEYCVVAGQAVFPYSLMSPSHLVDFTM